MTDKRIRELERAATLVCDTFKHDMAQGYTTRDKEFAVSILSHALSDVRAPDAAEEDERPLVRAAKAWGDQLESMIATHNAYVKGAEKRIARAREEGQRELLAKIERHYSDEAARLAAIGATGSAGRCWTIINEIRALATKELT